MPDDLNQMLDNTGTPDQMPQRYIIQHFSAGPGAALNGAAAFLSRSHEEGYELVTAYACPHPTGSMILHHFVLRRRDPAVLAPTLLSEEDTKALFASLVQHAGELMPLPGQPAVNRSEIVRNPVVTPEPSKGGQRKQR